MRRSWLRVLVGFAISVVLLLLLARTVDLGSMWQALVRADLRTVPLAIGLYFVALWLRARRWGLLLPGHKADGGMLFRALAVGFTVNNLLPVRMGEVARAYLLNRWGGVSVGATVASLVVERVLDGLALAALLLVSLALIPAPGYLLGIGLAVGGVFCIGAGMMVLVAWRPDFVLRLAGVLARPLPERARSFVERAAASFVRALRLVRGERRLAALAALSLLAWTVELGLFYVLMLGFALPASFPLALLGGSAANFATLIPSSPGYVGTFDGALIRVLTDTVPVTAEVAAAYTLLVHATLFLPVTILGVLILWREQVRLSDVTGSASLATEPSTR